MSFDGLLWVTMGYYGFRPIISMIATGLILLNFAPSPYKPTVATVGRASVATAVGISRRLPVENLAEVVILGIVEVCLGSLVVLRSDVVHKVVDNLVNLVGVDIHQAWWYLASLGVLQIL